MIRVVHDDLVAGHAGDRCVTAQHFASERVVGEQCRREQLVHDVVGRVVAHADLFEDDLPLGFHVGGTERGLPEHVGEDVERGFELRIGNAHVEHGLLVRRERVHLAANRLDGLGDLTGAARLRALEEQMLEKVARAPLRRGLVARTASDPRAECHRAQPGQRLTDDA